MFLSSGDFNLNPVLWLKLVIATKVTYFWGCTWWVYFLTGLVSCSDPGRDTGLVPWALAAWVVKGAGEKKSRGVWTHLSACFSIWAWLTSHFPGAGSLPWEFSLLGNCVEVIVLWQTIFLGWEWGDSTIFDGFQCNSKQRFQKTVLRSCQY